jgi:hypothetical protein
MAHSTIERLLASQHGNLHEVIPPMVQELGQVGASQKLGVTQNWVSRWLKDNGYKPKIVYTRTHDMRGQNHA